jgi:hypothetical protein
MEDKRFQIRTPASSGEGKPKAQEKPRYTDEDFEEMERLLMKISCLNELQKARLERESRPFRF